MTNLGFFLHDTAWTPNCLKIFIFWGEISERNLLLWAVVLQTTIEFAETTKYLTQK